MYRVSVCQFEPKLLDLDYNLKRMSEMIATVDTDLIVFPELATSGYVFRTKEEVRSISESIPAGKDFKAMQELSRVHDCSLVYGFSELDGSKLYNSSALVNPDGSYQIYRKTHLFYREKLFFEPGDTGFAIANAKGGITIGMMICFDWQFPEAMRSLALQGAMIVCHPSNLVLPWCQEAMKTRSLENRCYSITSNRIGTEINGDQKETFTGASQILGIKGEILIRLATDSEDIATLVIDPRLAQDKTVTPHNDAFTDRRPDMYILG